MKHLVNWNVNGIRSIIKKDFVSNINMLAPDVFCLQETKAAAEEVRSALALFPDYHVYVNSSKARKGYSGTAILSKEEPLRVSYDMGIDEYDQEGRVITAEYPTFFLTTVYTPNAGEGLARLDYRTKWDIAFREHLLWLSKRKPVITCGDFNVAHQPIDIARPKENYNKSAGYTQQEIDGFTQLLEASFIDTYRTLYPEEIKYTYWNYMFNARAKNVGWRIDYFLINQSLKSQLKEALIYNECHGSDHCPVGIKIEI